MHAIALLVAIYWQPPGSPPLGPGVRAAFIEATRPLGARFVDGNAPSPPPAPSLVPALQAAEGEYARFQFADAFAKLDELAQKVDVQGGGDLDQRQLSEIFLYRGLCRLETGADAAAWDDLVRAARLDPARVLDPVSFPPRAVAAYKRAVAEAAQLPRAELEIVAPADARVRLDGAAAYGATAVTFGAHFVSVAAEGYEPWAGIVSASSAQVRFTPPLHAYQPPDGDRLLALAGPAQQILLGALERSPGGWRFVARDITLPGGTSLSDAVALGEAPLKPAVAGVVQRVLPAAATEPAAPRRKRWWPWAVGGGAAALVVAGAITLGVVLGGSSAQVVAK